VPSFNGAVAYLPTVRMYETLGLNAPIASGSGYQEPDDCGPGQVGDDSPGGGGGGGFTGAAVRLALLDSRARLTRIERLVHDGEHLGPSEEGPQVRVLDGQRWLTELRNYYAGDYGELLSGDNTGFGRIVLQTYGHLRPETASDGIGANQSLVSSAEIAAVAGTPGYFRFEYGASLPPSLSGLVNQVQFYRAEPHALFSWRGGENSGSSWRLYNDLLVSGLSRSRFCELDEYEGDIQGPMGVRMRDCLKRTNGDQAADRRAAQRVWEELNQATALSLKEWVHTTDRNGNNVYTAINPLGQTLLRATQMSANGQQWQFELYRYDGRGNLVAEQQAAAVGGNIYSGPMTEFVYDEGMDNILARHNLLEIIVHPGSVPDPAHPLYAAWQQFGALDATQPMRTIIVYEDRYQTPVYVRTPGGDSRWTMPAYAESEGMRLGYATATFPGSIAAFPGSADGLSGSVTFSRQQVTIAPQDFNRDGERSVRGTQPVATYESVPSDTRAIQTAPIPGTPWGRIAGAATFFDYGDDGRLLNTVAADGTSTRFIPGQQVSRWQNQLVIVTRKTELSATESAAAVQLPSLHSEISARTFAVFDDYGRATLNVSSDGITHETAFDGFHRPVAGGSRHVAASGWERSIMWQQTYDGRGRISHRWEYTSDPSLLQAAAQQAPWQHGDGVHAETLNVYAADSAQVIATCVSGISGICDSSATDPFEWPSCFTSSEEDLGAHPDCPRWTWTTLDHEDRVIAVQDQPDSIQRMTRDAMGRPVWQWSGPSSSTSAVGMTIATVTRYDEFGRPAESIDASDMDWPGSAAFPVDPAGHFPADASALAGRFRQSWLYDQFGRLVAQSSSGGSIAVAAYDRYGRVVRDVLLDPEDPGQPERETSYTFAPGTSQLKTTTQTWRTGSNTSEQPAIRATVLARDIFGRPVRMTESEGNLNAAGSFSAVGDPYATCTDYAQGDASVAVADSRGALAIQRSGSVSPTGTRERSWSGSFQTPLCTTSGWRTSTASWSDPHDATRITTESTPASGSLLLTRELWRVDGAGPPEWTNSVTQESSYAPNGWLTTSRSETGVQTNYAYDWRGLIARTETLTSGVPEVQTFITDDLARASTITGADGRVASQAWDHLGRPVAQGTPTVISAGSSGTNRGFVTVMSYPSRTQVVQSRLGARTSDPSGFSLEVSQTELDPQTLRPTALLHCSATGAACTPAPVVDDFDWHHDGTLLASTRHDHAGFSVRTERTLDGLSRSLSVTTTITAPGQQVVTDTADMSWGDASLGLGRLAGLSVNSAPMYALTDTDSQRRPVEEVFDDHLSSLSKWRADRLSSTRVSLDGDFAAAWLSTLMDYSPNGQLVATEWSTVGQGDENPLAAESIARTVDGRTAMHQWAWAEPSGASAASNTLADFSETRGFAYDERGFLIRDHRIIGHPGAIAASLPDFADVYQPGDGASLIAALDASTLTTINDAFTWSQHGTPLSVVSTVQPPSAAAVNTTWQPGRPAAAPHSPLPTDLNGSAIHWDAFGRFHSHAGVAWERTAFDDRPVHVTVSHDDPLTAEHEHAVSLRHHAPDGTEVYEQRTEVDGTTARILRTWVGGRLVRERDDAGWSRTWHQRAHQDVPFAYTIACDVAVGDCATAPAWLGATAVLLNADDRATYALIHNYRGDVVGLLNEGGHIVEQYSYDVHGTLQVRACVTTESCDGAGLCTPTTTCGPAVKPVAGEHAGNHGNTLLYAGTHRDPVTGHSRMGARWYDPEQRAFLSRDPAGYTFSFDEWAYTVGDPWNFVDRTGWMACPVLNPGAAECRAPEEHEYETWDDFMNTVTTVGGLAVGTVVVVVGVSYTVTKAGLALVASGTEAISSGLSWLAVQALAEEAPGTLPGPVPTGSPQSNGRAYEDAVREKLELEERTRFQVDGRNRISDGTLNDAHVEVKHTEEQGLTRQFRDYIEDSVRNSRPPLVFVHPVHTILTEPLRQAIESGLIQEIILDWYRGE
jgi:RHS repeat-associated protein